MIPRQSFIVIATCALLFTIPACTLPTNTPPSSGGNAAPITPQPLPPPTITKTMTATTLPTLDPQAPLTFGGAATATTTFTFTPLPPIPDFDKVLGFGAGGGDAPCLGGPDSEYPGIKGGTQFIGYFLPRTAVLCIWGAPFNEPLSIQLTSPSGAMTLTTVVEVRGEQVTWLEFDSLVSYSLAAGSNITSIFLNIWWPGNLESGSWNVKVKWNGGEIFGIFSAETRIRPEISVFDDRSETQLLPGRCHQLSTNDNIKVIGENFPANSLAYMLLYSDTESKYYQEHILLYAQPVQTDQNGFFVLELNQNIEIGQRYSLLGISNPQLSLTKPDGSFNYDVVADAIDCFYFDPNPSTSLLSCPGAPPQRMALSQRGYVCTKSDDVRLRDAPFRSANTINYLPVGSQFTVLDGPSCADNWSWWQIRTDYGVTGWIAEGGDQVDPYFICPMP